jgi:Ca2+-transporting ATPase
VLNAIVGVWQESNAESALEALKEMQSETARCLRDGQWRHDFPARELVPGDFVEIRTGDRVPADARVFALKTATVRVDQASLTGESVSVGKITEPVNDPNCELQAKENVVFGGTAVTQGSCHCVIIATGTYTSHKILLTFSCVVRVNSNGFSRDHVRIPHNPEVRVGFS